jgi:hypothetical protein
MKAMPRIPFAILPNTSSFCAYWSKAISCCRKLHTTLAMVHCNTWLHALPTGTASGKQTLEHVPRFAKTKNRNKNPERRARDNWKEADDQRYEDRPAQESPQTTLPASPLHTCQPSCKVCRRDRNIVKPRDLTSMRCEQCSGLQDSFHCLHGRDSTHLHIVPNEFCWRGRRRRLPKALLIGHQPHCHRALQLPLVQCHKRCGRLLQQT